MLKQDLITVQESRAMRTRDLDIKVKQYIVWKLEHRQFKKRPLEIKYLRIAKAVNVSYTQARFSVRRLEKRGEIESWTAWQTLKNGDIVKRKFYRLPCG